MSEDQSRVLVPRRATKAMLDAAYEAHDAYEASNEPCGWGGLGSVYQAMIEAAPAEAGKGAGWLPIDTAPKDGTQFLALTMEAQSPTARISWWEENRFLTTGKPEKFVDPLPHRWWPTHWQPMPSAPQQPTEASDPGLHPSSAASTADPDREGRERT